MILHTVQLQSTMDIYPASYPIPWYSPFWTLVINQLVTKLHTYLSNPKVHYHAFIDPALSHRLSGAMGMTKHTDTSSATHCKLASPSEINNNKMTIFRINGKQMT